MADHDDQYKAHTVTPPGVAENKQSNHSRTAMVQCNPGKTSTASSIKTADKNLTVVASERGRERGLSEYLFL